MDLNIETNIEMMVLLLAIYKKEENESLIDIVKTLENSNVFSFKEGKKFLKILKNDKYILDDRLTMIGIQKAKEAEMAFKI